MTFNDLVQIPINKESQENWNYLIAVDQIEGDLMEYTGKKCDAE